jgi:hypothetical protein
MSSDIVPETKTNTIGIGVILDVLPLDSQSGPEPIGRQFTSRDEPPICFSQSRRNWAVSLTVRKSPGVVAFLVIALIGPLLVRYPRPAVHSSGPALFVPRG